MSAVYNPKDFGAQFNTQFNAVLTYVGANPGTSVDAIATALAIPYEVAYAICSQSGMVVLPSTSGEIQFQAHDKKG